MFREKREERYFKGILVVMVKIQIALEYIRLSV
nr:MAG TPA: hypothetical protein [Caudoviricetes sp.]